MKLKTSSLDFYWQSLKIPPRMTVSQWADKHRYLSSESSAEAGKWKNDRVPYQVGFMDSLNDPDVETIVWMSSSQVGKTEAGLNLLGYHIDQDPCPVLIVLPNLDESRSFSKIRLQPMMRDTPCLRGKLRETRGRQAKETGVSNEMLHKTFPGGHLTMVGSNSASGLSSRPIRIVYMDELDRFELSAGNEGDQVQLAKRRTATFWNRKIVLTSTPGVKGISRIEAWYEASDQRKYFLPCPHCQQFQVLSFKGLQWDKGPNDEHLFETAHFVCEYCESRIDERHKSEMLRQGEWFSTSTEGDPKVRGFHIWAAYSPWVRWSEIAREFVTAKRQGKEALKAFINTVLGESFEEAGEAPQWQLLADRAEMSPMWNVPTGVLFVTCGVDVQTDRLEASVWGWGKEEECWLLGHEIITGDPDLNSTWDELDKLLAKPLTQASSQRQFHIAIACVDTGYKTQAVYRYARSRPMVYATKGSSSMTAPRVGRPTYQDLTFKGEVVKRGVRLWQLGTHILKSTLYSRLQLKEQGPRYVHFPQGLGEEYYKQLTAEHLVNQYHKGHVKQEWRQIRPRNETLDCFVLAYAAALLAGIERMPWDKIEPAAAPAVASAPVPVTPATVPAARRGRVVHGGQGALRRLLDR